MNPSVSSTRRTSLMALVLGMAVSAAAPFSHALAQSSNRVVVNIPFDFQDGSAHLKAGRYTINMQSEHVMVLDSGTAATFVQSRVEDDWRTSSGNKVVFRAYGNQYFLREVWLAGGSQHQVLPKSKAEKRILIGQSGPAPNGTEVALLEANR